MVLLEVFLLPSLIAGLIGVGLFAWGVYRAFVILGANWGWTILITAIITDSILAWLIFKNIDRSGLAVKEEIDGRVNMPDHKGVQPGEIGKTLTDLRPEGKGLFDNKVVSVWTFGGGFLSSGVQVEVLKIEDNKIYVKEKI